MSIKLFHLASICLTLAASEVRAQANRPLRVKVPRTQVEGEFIVGLKAGTPHEKVQQLHASLAANGTQVKRLPNIDAMVVRVPKEQAAALHETRARVVAANPEISYIEPNYVYHHADKLPNDLKYGDQWHLPRIKAPAAWEQKSDSPEIIVAVIDSGVFLEHEDLKENLWRNPKETGQDAAGKDKATNGVDDDGNGIVDDVYGADFVNNDGTPEAELQFVSLGIFEDPTRKEYQQHASHVCGIIGAVGNNHLGTAGVTWKVKIMVLKFFGGPNGGGATDDAIRAIDYAIAHNAHVINASWGGSQKSQALNDAIARAQAAGIDFVAAAGNGDENGVGVNIDVTPFYPAAFSMNNVIAVAATDQNDALAAFSNYGIRTVHVGAPGVDILSTLPGGIIPESQFTNPPPPTNDYGKMSGTSMATPVVAGTVAILRSANPNLSFAQVKRLVLETVDTGSKLATASALDGKVTTNGRLNLGGALNPPVSLPVAQQLANLSASQRAAISGQLTPEARTRFLLSGNGGRKPLVPLKPESTGADSILIGVPVTQPAATPTALLTELNVTDSQIEHVAPGVVKLNLGPNQSAKDTAERASRLPGVRYAEPNVKYHLQAP